MRTLRDEEGVLSTQAVVLMPLALTVFFIVAQFGFWMYANVAVEQAAQHAAQTLALNGANPSYNASTGANNAARAVLAGTSAVPGSTLKVSGAVSGGSGQVAVSAEPHVILPGLEWTVTSTKTFPIERFVPFSERS